MIERANATESWITLVNRGLGRSSSPLNRMTAMMEAATMTAPSRRSGFGGEKPMLESGFLGVSTG
jgi:hypothetical protein